MIIPTKPTTKITHEPYWIPIFEGFKKSREWMKKADYEGFDKDLGSARYELGSGINYSAQSIPYRGGLMIGYKF